MQRRLVTSLQQRPCSFYLLSDGIRTVFRPCAQVLCAFLLALAVSADARAQSDIAKAEVLYSLPGMDDVPVRRDIVYKSSEARDLSLDIYYPPESKDPLPLVVFVFGYADEAASKLVGVSLKDVQAYISWPKLVAASGMAALTYETDDPDSDLRDLLQYVRRHGEELRIDPARIGFWSCSGNVPVAVSHLVRDSTSAITFAVLYYGLMPTPDGRFQPEIGAFADRVGFVAPELPEGAALPPHIPLFVVRAGRDTEEINATIDHFVARAIAANAPITLLNYAEGRHAFDLLDDTAETREVVRRTLSFMRSKSH